MLNLTELSLTPLEINPVDLIPLLPSDESLDLELPQEAANFEAILGELIAGAISEQPVTPAEEEEEPGVKEPADTGQQAGVLVVTMPLPGFGPEELVREQPDLKRVEIGALSALLTEGWRIGSRETAQKDTEGRLVQKDSSEQLPALAGASRLPTLPSGFEEEGSTPSSDDFFAKYEVRKIEFAFEQTEQPAATIKPGVVQQLFITDPLASVRQGGRPAVQLVRAAGETAFNGKARHHDGQPSETPREDLTVSFTGAPRHEFQTEVVKVESVRSVPDIELPPPPPVARRVSMEIGELDSQVTVTIRERNGDLTLHFEAANNDLRHDLEASVDSLSRMFEREQLRLADVGFNSFGSATDAEQQSPDQRSRKNLKPGAVFADKDETYQFHHAAFAIKSNEIAS